VNASGADLTASASSAWTFGGVVMDKSGSDAWAVGAAVAARVMAEDVTVEEVANDEETVEDASDASGVLPMMTVLEVQGAEIGAPPKEMRSMGGERTVGDTGAEMTGVDWFWSSSSSFFCFLGAVSLVAVFSVVIALAGSATVPPSRMFRRLTNPSGATVEEPVWLETAANWAAINGNVAGATITAVDEQVTGQTGRIGFQRDSGEGCGKKMAAETRWQFPGALTRSRIDTLRPLFEQLAGFLPPVSGMLGDRWGKWFYGSTHHLSGEWHASAHGVVGDVG
jgi:hypothetical protein